MKKRNTAGLIIKQIGAKVELLRIVKGFTKAQLAKKAKIAISSLRDVEKARRSTHLSTLFKISKALCVEVSDLFPNE